MTMGRSDKIYIGTNTKMYKTIQETVDFLDRLKKLTADLDRDRCQLFVIPSYTALEKASQVVSDNFILLGAQNMAWEEKGQYTGEISPIMLKEAGTKLVMIGHSERRHILGETDEEENKKVCCALEHGFTVLLCIGETQEQKKKNIADEILKLQLKLGLYKVTRKQSQKLWIAYEPVWAIGTNGIPASKEYADEKHEVIKKALAEIFGREAGAEIPVLYGGSVNNENAKELIQMPNIDGLFIGRSAWDADNFNRIIRMLAPIKQSGFQL